MTLICINGIVEKVDKRCMGGDCCKWCKIKVNIRIYSGHALQESAHNAFCSTTRKTLKKNSLFVMEQSVS